MHHKTTSHGQRGASGHGGTDVSLVLGQRGQRVVLGARDGRRAPRRRVARAAVLDEQVRGAHLAGRRRGRRGLVPRRLVGGRVPVVEAAGVRLGLEHLSGEGLGVVCDE